MSLDNIRRQLAHPVTSIQLSLLGVLAGISSAVMIILFRLSIEKLQLLFVVQFDNFTSLTSLERFALPLAGSLLIAGSAIISRYKHYRMGIPFVIHRIKMKYGDMPIKNAINQFVGGILALVSGFSVGREGPSVHIGASSASYVGVWLKLPYNSIRTLTGCGISAAIAASFNTPLAAVIFVMEVVFREYKIHVFIPIMLSAVIGAMLTRMVFGDHHELSFFTIDKIDSINYLYLIVCSAMLSAVAWAFNSSMMSVMIAFRPVGMVTRLLLAGIITAIIGYFVPHALGSGMGAIQFALSDTSGFKLIAAIFISKFFATILALGLGIPGGIIGPILGLGVLLGALFGIASASLGLDNDHIALYAALGMGGLMAATLHSPLAALVALLELTANPDLIAPAMFVITLSYIFSVQWFGNRSILLRQLEYQQLEYKVSPATEALQKVGVLAYLDNNYQIIDDTNEEEVSHYLSTQQNDHSLIIRDNYVVGSELKLAEYTKDAFIDEGVLAARSVDEQQQIHYWPMQGVSSQATLAEAFELLHSKRGGAVYIYQDNFENIVGIIRWHQLRRLLIERNKLI
ncbi:MAG: CIC family chloride channel protein [Alteromonadaceae bacterium]|jgi:CIC family chloride channel protein